MVALSQAKITLEDIEGIFADEDLGTEAVLEAQLQYQAEQGVSLRNGPCLEVASQLAHFSHVTGEDWTSKWTEAAEGYADNLVDLSDVFERERKHNSESAEDAALAARANAAERMNDTEILGQEPKDYDFEAFLERPIVFMTGDLFGQNDRRNTRPGNWKRVEMPLINWMVGGELKDGTPWGLTRHPVHRDKGGSSIVPSDNFDGERTAEATHTMYAVGVDIDTGRQLERVKQRLLDAGIFALIYTTHSHLKSSMSIKTEVIQKALKIKDTPTRTQVQEFLTHHHKERHSEEFIADIEIVDAKKHTKDGLHVVIKHPAVEKFRVVIPLEEPVKLTDLADSFLEWKTIWADAVAGVCVNILDAQFDTASCDINRLFYSPRHPEGGEFYSAVILGKPLRFEDIEPFSKDKYVRDRSASGDPFLADSNGYRKEVGAYVMPKSGKSLNEWHKHAKNRFELVDVIQTYAPDKIRVAGGERQGTIHIECPFEHEHTTPGGTACMVMNPDANKEEVWTVFCHHDSCQGRHKLEFLQEMLSQGWFDERVLLDEQYMIPLSDQERDDYLEAQRAGPITDHSEDCINAALADASLTDDLAIKTFMRRCLDGGADTVARAAIIHEVAQVTKVTKPDLKKMWKSVEKEMTKQDRDPRRMRKAGERLSIYTPGNFRNNCEGLYEFLQAQGDEPYLFHSNGRLVDAQEDENGNIRIAVFEKDRFKASVLEERADFYEVRKDGDETETEAPSGIVNNVFHKPRTVYPPLTRVTGVPTFDVYGSLMDEPGYHPSGVIYHPKPALASMPRVSGSPSYDEARNSVLTWADLVADFCLDGVTDRDEFIARVMDGEEVPSFSHMMTAGLGPIMRDQIAGPLPITLFRKDKPRTGASLLATTVQFASTLEEIAPTTLPTEKAEMQKVLTAFFDSGAPNLFIDNLPRKIDSGELAAAVTAYPNYLGRRLGYNEFVNVAARGQFICTGNRVGFSEELAPRTQLVTLDPKIAQPENRTGFKYPTIMKHVKKNVGDYLHALLTIGQYWNNDRILWDGHPLGGFEVHNEVMGGVLDAVGVKGYLTNRETLKAVNAIGEEEEMMDRLIEYHLEELDDKPGTVFRVIGSQTPPKGHEFADYRVISIRSVLDTHSIALDGSNYTVDESGGVHYSDKAKKKLPQVIAGLAAKGGVGGLVREWDELVVEDRARQGRYYLESAGSDRHSTFYRVVYLPNPDRVC